MKIMPPLPNIKITPELVDDINNMDIKNFKETESYQKYCGRYQHRHKEMKKRNRIIWWKNNWIGIVTLIATILSLIATVLFGLLQLSN